MGSWFKTIGFAATFLSSTALISGWCQVVHFRFRVEHPGAVGSNISNFYWDFPWIGIGFATILSVILSAAHIRKHDALYNATYCFSIWLLVVWFGVALIAMELPWGDLHGYHY